MLTEDLCVLAALKTGRPVKWEFTRTEQFTAATTRHPMRITVKLGAKKDGTLTAMQIRNISNTGAYGNHGGEILASSLGSCMATYTCANKKGTGYAVYTNTVPSGAFRGYGATQPAFAIECAIDELGRKLGIDPFTFRRKNMIKECDPVHSIWPFPHDGVIGSYGLDQCLDFVEQALASGRGEPKPDGNEWLEGKGVAIHAQDCAPPTEHRSEAQLSLLESGTFHLSAGACEFGNGIRNAQRQVAATVLYSKAADIAMDFVDTDLQLPGKDGTFASTGADIATPRRREGRCGAQGKPPGAGEPAFRHAGRTVRATVRESTLRGSITLAPTALRRRTAAKQTPRVAQSVRIAPFQCLFGPWLPHCRA